MNDALMIWSQFTPACAIAAALRQVAAVIGVAEGEHAHDRQRRSPSSAGRPPAPTASTIVPTMTSTTAGVPCRLRNSSNPPPPSAISKGNTGYRHAANATAASSQSIGVGSRTEPRARPFPSIRDAAGAAAGDRSGSTAGSMAAPPPGTRSVRPGCPARAERTPDTARTARLGRSGRHRMAYPPGQLAGRFFLLIGGRRRDVVRPAPAGPVSRSLSVSWRAELVERLLGTRDAAAPGWSGGRCPARCRRPPCSPSPDRPCCRTAPWSAHRRCFRPYRL